MFGLKMELTAWADLVGDTTEQSCIFLTVYDSINDMKHLETVCITPQQFRIHFVVDCCQFGSSWVFGLKLEPMASAYESINDMKYL